MLGTPETSEIASDLGMAGAKGIDGTLHPNGNNLLGVDATGSVDSSSEALVESAPVSWPRSSAVASARTREQQDPVRALRRMETVPLLDREGEVEISRLIEEAEHNVYRVLLDCRLALRDLSERFAIQPAKTAACAI